MTDEKQIRSLERRARVMMASREIPQSRMDVVRALFNNENLLPEERYNSIIDLVKLYPEKKVKRGEKGKAKISDERLDIQDDLESEKHASCNEVSDLYSPIEIPVYLDSLFHKYRHLKLFKKRFFVHRNNRFGIGIRKRYIPTRKLVKLLKDVYRYQEYLTGKLSSVLNAILEDSGAADPTVFNYLRIIHKWLLNMPLIKYHYEEIKWMERIHFEREFRSYVMNFFSIKKIEAKTKERIIEEVDRRLRSIEGYQKDEILHNDPESEKRKKEKSNLTKEKEIYRFNTVFRSFLSTINDDELPLAILLKDNFGIKNFSELLLSVMELLVFQRSISNENMLSYYSIESPKVSDTEWDYSEEILKKYRKDQESLKGDQTNLLRDELAAYETIAYLLNLTDGGENLLIKAADDQWKYVDKKHYNPRLVYTDNFIAFLDAVINFFNQAYSSFLDGSPILFRDPAQREYDGMLFTTYYFEEELHHLTKILNEMHKFRSSNPTLAVPWSEIKKIMESKGNTSSNLWRSVMEVGDFFYKLGKALQRLYEKHKIWVYNKKPLRDQSIIRKPAEPAIIEAEHEETGRPLPFYDCILVNIQNAGVLTKNFYGKRLLNDTMDDGLYVKMIAFAFQTAYECFNEMIFADMERRKAIMRELKKSEK